MTQVLADPSSSTGGTTAILNGLLVAWRNGSEVARNDLFDYVRQRLIILCQARLGPQDRLLASAEIDDLVQEAMARFLKALETTHFENARHFLNIANQHLMWAIADLCRLADRLDREMGTTFMWEIPNRDGDAEIPHAQLLNSFLLRLQEMPEEHREVFSLWYFHDMTHAEIAATLGISVSTSKRRLYEAREFLKKIFA